MSEPPYQSQGKALDDDCGFDGEWVIENEVFLFEPPPTETFATLQIRPGENCGGFNAEELAKAMQISVADLLTANRSGKLFATWRVEKSSGPLEGRTMRYAFQIGDNAITGTVYVSLGRA